MFRSHDLQGWTLKTQVPACQLTDGGMEASGWGIRKELAPTHVVVGAEVEL